MVEESNKILNFNNLKKNILFKNLIDTHLKTKIFILEIG